MARRRKKTAWLFIIIIAVALVSLFSSYSTEKKQEGDTIIQEPALILTYENGVDFTNFIFNK